MEEREKKITNICGNGTKASCVFMCLSSSHNLNQQKETKKNINTHKNSFSWKIIIYYYVTAVRVSFFSHELFF